MDAGVVWQVAAVVVPTLAGLAAGMTALTPPSFRAARVCLSASTAWLVASAVLWWYLSPKNDVTLRVSAGSVVAAGIGLILGLRWITARETAANTAPGVSKSYNDVRDRVLLLAAQLRRFIAQRHENDPSVSPTNIDAVLHDLEIAYPGITTTQMAERERKREKRTRAHAFETMDIYDDKFAAGVAGIRKLFRTAGFRSAELKKLDKYPTDIRDVAQIADALNALASSMSSEIGNADAVNAIRPKHGICKSGRDDWLPRSFKTFAGAAGPDHHAANGTRRWTLTTVRTCFAECLPTTTPRH